MRASRERCRDDRKRLRAAMAPPNGVAFPTVHSRTGRPQDGKALSYLVAGKTKDACDELKAFVNDAQTKLSTSISISIQTRPRS